jgi:hypothetical protein
MAALAPFFNAQFFTNVGVPAAGFLLHSYESGTTTPKQTFTSQAATATNTNPIVLDADGRCNLWLDSGEYTFRLETPDGALVKSWDDVAGIPLAGENAFVPLAGNVTMTGRFNLAGPAQSGLQPVTLTQMNDAITGVTTGSGFATVTQLNTATTGLQGQITTNAGNITTANGNITTLQGNVVSLLGVPVNTTAGGVDGQATNIAESFSLDLSAWPAGRVRGWQNTTGSNLTLTVTGGTLRLNGTTATGNRTILPFGLVTLRAFATGVVVISGGVS